MNSQVIKYYYTMLNELYLCVNTNKVSFSKINKTKLNSFFSKYNLFFSKSSLKKDFYLISNFLLDKLKHELSNCNDVKYRKEILNSFNELNLFIDKTHNKSYFIKFILSNLKNGIKPIFLVSILTLLTACGGSEGSATSQTEFIQSELIQSEFICTEDSLNSKFDYEGELFDCNVQFNDNIRNFSVYVPKQINDILFSFHGYGGNRNDILLSTNLVKDSDKSGSVMIVPKSHDYEGWEIDEELDIGDLEFSNAILSYIKKKYNIGTLPVKSVGLSFGGIFSLYFSNLYNSLTDVVSIAGLEKITDVDNIKINKLPTSTLIIIGNNDVIVPYSGGGSSFDSSYKFYPANQTLERLAYRNGNKSSTIESIFENNLVKIDISSTKLTKSDASILFTLKGLDHYDVFRNPIVISGDYGLDNTFIELNVEALNNLFLNNKNLFYLILENLKNSMN
jgi:poly(3-hydroxybutyrate) depolymerase